MKRFTFMLIAVFAMLASYAAGPQKRTLAGQMLPTATQLQLGQKLNAKKAPKQLATKQLAKARAPKKAVSAADFVGDYTWDYLTASDTSTDLTTLETSSGSSHVVISESATTEGGITISGMFPNDIEATLDSDEDGSYFVISGGQAAGTSSYGDYVIYGLFYYEGDETYDAGWYYDDIYGYLNEDGSIEIYPWISRVLSGGDYDGYSLKPYWVEGSTLTPSEPLTVVELPEGVTAQEFVMTYDDGSTPVNVAVDGNDVYFQGMSSYIPTAWVKGTKDGDQVTFAAMQYMGEYGSNGSSYFFYNGETVFTYDAEANTYSATGQVYGVLAERYYDGNYTNPVIKPVVEKAAMPADPKITALKNGSYGWYFTFNVPLEDTEGEPLMASKLSYMIYTDIEGEIAPLTFTPETHSKLEEAITEIPYGFTEDYDFYDTQIYLNDLYSADWNNLGIQSIYRGGGEENVTEVQWFHIKDYATPDGDFTFNFNEMSVKTSSNTSSEGDITEDFVVTEGSVTLTVSPKDESASNPNRFWSTTAGPQLRMYSGTMTFEVPEGLSMTNMVFNYAKWGKDDATNVTADSGTFTDDAENKVATWTGDAQKVVISVAANTQLNSIVVTVTGGEEPSIEPVVAPEGLTTDTWYLTCNSYNGMIRGRELQVGITSDYAEVYVQGLCEYLPEAWVKGTIDPVNMSATFKSGQFYGTDIDDGENYDLYFVGYDPEANEIADVVATVDLTTGQITTDQYILLNSEQNEMSYYDYYYNVVITKEMPEMPEVVVAPEDLTTEPYFFKGYDTYYEEDATKEVQVGFYGEDQVYIQGLSDYVEDAWVVGTIEGGVVTIPETYMGIYEGFFGSLDVYFSGASFVYDAEAETFTSEDGFVSYETPEDEERLDEYTNVVLTKLHDVAATPADPEITDFVPTGNYPKVKFNIPVEGVDGTPLMQDKLTYTLYFEKDGEQKALTLTTDLYEKLEEDMTEIPYGFSDSWDIYIGTVYLNQGEEELATWTNIGIQTTYYGGGETHKSNLVWFKNEIQGISQMATDSKEVRYYNLNGQRIDKPAKGLYIMNGKKAVVK